MINLGTVLNIINDSLNGLYESSMIEERITVGPDTPLFGGGSGIDSMSFVALMTDIEDRLSKLEKKDIFVVLSDVEDLYPDSPTLTADMLSNYLVVLVNDPKS